MGNLVSESGQKVGLAETVLNVPKIFTVILTEVTVPSKLGWSDRLGVAVASLLGTVLGLLIATASDIRLTPNLFIVFTGIAVGLPAHMMLGATAGVIACGVSNGLAYAALMYGWYRVVLFLRLGIPRG